MAHRNSRWNRLRLAMLTVMMLMAAMFPGAHAQDATPIADPSESAAENQRAPINAPYLWRTELASPDSSYGASQVETWENRVYVLEPNGRLRTFDAEFGSVLSDHFVGSRPLHHADFLYVDDQYIVAGEAERTIALDRRTGAQLWEVSTDFGIGTGVLSYPTIAEGAVYMTDGPGKQIPETTDLFAVDLESGAERWRVTVDGMDSFPVTVIDGLVFANEEDGDVTAFDAATGSVRWSVRFATHARAIFPLAPGIVGFQYQSTTPDSSPAIAAVDASTGAISWELPAPAEYLATAGTMAFVETGDWLTGDSELRAIDGQTGATAWSLPLPNESVVLAAVREGTLYATTLSSELPFADAHSRLLKIQVGTGNVERETPLAQGARALSFAGDSLVFGTEGSLLAVDSETLRPKFELVGSNGRSIATDASGRMFTVDQTDMLNALDPDRFEPFTASMTTSIAPAVSALSGYYASLTTPPEVLVGLWEIEIETGGTFPVPSSLDGSAFVLSGTVVVERPNRDTEVRDGPFVIGTLRSSPLSLTNSGSGPAVVLIAATTNPDAAPANEQVSEYRLELLGSLVFTEPPTPAVTFSVVGFDIPPGWATAPSTSLNPRWIFAEEGSFQLMESQSVAPALSTAEGFVQSPVQSGVAQSVSQNSLVQLFNSGDVDTRAWTVELSFGGTPFGGGCNGRCRG